jgi:hypothetical protein
MGGRKRQERVAILIAGVHRSGTSPLARVLNLLGGALPKTLLAPNAANEAGYWESPLVNRLNNEILALAGSDWRSWQPLRKGWDKDPAARPLKEQALAMLQSEFGDATLLVLKDPRICRLIGFWREVLEDFGARAVAVCPIRNPLEVAASVGKRNGFVPAITHLIWLRYALDAELATRTMPRSFASYGRLLVAWREVVERIGRDLDIAWPREPESVAREVEAFLSSAHRHHTLLAEGVNEPEWLRTSYAVFSRWAEVGERRLDYKALDGVRRAFDDIPSVLQPLIAASHEQIDAARLLKKRIALDDTELARLQAQIDTDAQRLQEINVRLAESVHRLGERDLQVQAATEQLGTTRAQLAESFATLARRDVELEAHREEVQRSQARLRDAERAAAEKATQLNTQLADARRQLAQRDEELEAARRESERGHALLAARAKELAQAVSRAVKLEADAKARQAELDEVNAALDRLEQELASEKDSSASLHAALNRAQADVARARREAEQRLREAKDVELELHRIQSTRTWKIVQALHGVARQTYGLVKRSRSGRQERERVALLGSSALFDRDWYLTQYPDVAAAGIDPTLHYLRHGAIEGRDPGPGFSTRWYLDTYEDVSKAGVNPLVHYLEHGKTERRPIAPSSAPPVLPPVASEAVVAAAEVLSLPLAEPRPAQWRRRHELAADKSRLSLEVCGVAIGTSPAGGPDIERALLALAPAARACLAFCRIMGMEPRHALRGRQGNAPLEVGEQLVMLADSPGRSVVAFQFSEPRSAIADIWYINDRDLRFRFKATDADRDWVVRIFQYDVAGAALAMVGESLVEHGGLDFVDAALVNAFLPVLVTLATPDGELVSATLLPFPSLCRGGVHYAELCSVENVPGYLDNLQALSRSLLAELVGPPDAAPFSVARLEVELRGAIGGEPIFSKPLREWLAVVMQARVRAAGAAPDVSPGVRELFDAELAALPVESAPQSAARIRAREESGLLALTIPVDAVPSLHALVGRGLKGCAGKPRTAVSFAVSDRMTVDPRWVACLPPFGEDLLELQPAHAGNTLPIVEVLRAAANDAANGSAPDPLPFAVRFDSTGARHPASLIMPVAPDVPGPLIRVNGRGHPGASISVIAAPRAQSIEVFAAMLDSLKLQTAADRVAEVIAVVDSADADGKRAARSALRRFFPERHRLLEHGAASRSALINHGAEHAEGQLLLIAGADIALHDPRTLEVLSVIADRDNVASASCVLVQAAAQAADRGLFRSAGIFPVRCSSSDDQAFAEPNCLAVFPCATYPVAGNSSALLVVRADVWRRLGGFDAERFPGAQADIEYGVRAIGQGLLHLCTSVISAELHDRDFGAPYHDVVLPSPMPASAWRTLGASTSRLQALKG